MTSLILVIFSAFVISLFLSILLLSKRDRSASERHLLFYLLFNALIFFSCYIYFHFHMEELQIIVMFTGLFQAPLLFYYANSLLKQQPPLLVRRMIILPALYTILLLLGFIILKPENELNSIFNSSIHSALFLLKISMFAEILFPPAVYIYILFLYGRYRSNLKQSYSYLEGLNLIWMRNLIALELVVWFAFVIYELIPVDIIDESSDYILFTAFSAGLLILLSFFGIRRTGIFVYHQEPPFPDSDISHRQSDSYLRSGLTEKKAFEIKNKIEQIVLKEKLFMEPELNISILSERIGEKPYNISQVFSGRLNTTFYDYINTLRVNEAAQKIRRGEADSKTLLAIALEAGFNSKASFNRYFKKRTNRTPSEYMKKVSAERQTR